MITNDMKVKMITGLLTNSFDVGFDKTNSQQSHSCFIYRSLYLCNVSTNVNTSIYKTLPFYYCIRCLVATSRAYQNM